MWSIATWSNAVKRDAPYSSVQFRCPTSDRRPNMPPVRSIFKDMAEAEYKEYFGKKHFDFSFNIKGDLKEMERRRRRQKREKRLAKELARHNDQQTDKKKKRLQEETVAEDEQKKKRKRLNDTANDASTSKDISKKDLNEKPLSKRELKKMKAALAKLEKKKDKEIRAINMAYAYLNKWKNCKNEWKFEKLRQIWLIDNLLSRYSISDEFFPVVLEYFEECKGSARETLIKKATELMKKAETEEDEEDKKVLMKTYTYKRARQILQTLSPSKEI